MEQNNQVKIEVQRRYSDVESSINELFDLWILYIKNQFHMGTFLLEIYSFYSEVNGMQTKVAKLLSTQMRPTLLITQFKPDYITPIFISLQMKEKLHIYPPRPNIYKKYDPNQVMAEYEHHIDFLKAYLLNCEQSQQVIFKDIESLVAKDQSLDLIYDCLRLSMIKEVSEKLYKRDQKLFKQVYKKYVDEVQQYQLRTNGIQLALEDKHSAQKYKDAHIIWNSKKFAYV